MAVCFPSIEQIRNFRVPLEDGELHLLEFLMNLLDDSYEIYVQPFLNGDRPDFVVMRKGSGVLIIEVKDWNLNCYQAEKGTGTWRVKSSGAKIRSPISQVEKYKSNLYNLHLPDLFNLSMADFKSFSIVKTAVYFHFENTYTAQRFCGASYSHVFGYDSLEKEKFREILQKSHLLRRSKFFKDDLYNSFHRFLQPPLHSSDEGIDIKYTKQQERLVNSKADSRQKIRGIAGCGKTKTLARRAVNAYLRTRSRVLVLTYNLTLRNYIHDKISEVRADYPWSSFEIIHYHGFFKRQANNYNLIIDDLLKDADKEDFFRSVSGKIHLYDTILIDEVQDYKEEWLRLISNYFLSEQGEFVVFGDEKQNIYKREMGEDKYPVIPQVRGRWNELKESFRLGDFTLKVAQSFQRTFLSEFYIVDDVPEQQSLLKNGRLYYELAEYYDENALYEKICFYIKKLHIHPNDVVILGMTFDFIRALDFSFRTEGKQKTTYMGETQEEVKELLKEFPLEGKRFEHRVESIRRNRKLHFWANAGTTKFSTVHSFKGWEAPTLILLIENTLNVEELVYVALTRAALNIIVLDFTGKYEDFFQEFVGV